MTSTNSTEGARSHAHAQAQRVWNHRHPGHRSFEPGTPWLLRYFDRIRFYPVSAEELLHLRAEMAADRGDARSKTVGSRSPTTSAFSTPMHNPSPTSAGGRPSRSRPSAGRGMKRGEFRRAG